MPRSSAAELIAAEVRLHRSVKAEVERAIYRETAGGGARLLALQLGLTAALAGTFELGIIGARRASAESLRRELEALRRSGADVAELETRIRRDEEADRMRSVAASGAIASGLVLMALEKSGHGKPIKIALRSAVSDNRPRVARNVATEVSRAFSDERERLLFHNYRKSTPGRTALVKAWNAANDRQTCPRCAELDGTEVPIGEDFEGGILPGFHAMCRCFIEVREARVSARVAA